ncbi:PepSY domain-containing protein [Halalkalibacter krulwichiae]|uniref:Peptidase propeptide and YPEB domain protein n=1 Tax=Halalkalibacter krulwichiae TaxID=199441 RepID=A0A1X9MIV5_9BACI|nr:PepSY domain-containing protein [Halalkalibacter krulwichiae]ARK32630.1 Peptidase propeptide and YPEB domain protein [Halalkalibacter krulwichiae]
MNKKLQLILVTGLLVAGATLAGASIKNSGETLVQDSETVLTREEATDIAIALTGGEVTEMKFNEENAHFEFELNVEGGDAKVTIDAVTGEIVELEAAKKKPQNSADSNYVSSYPEQEKLLELENAYDLQVEVVTDNVGKRVLLFVDSKGQTKYKSIFVKTTDHLKIIEINQGLVYNSTLK